MSAKHAVLGLLIEHPAHGYELAQRLEERCASMSWTATGVYQALDWLSREGYVCPQRGDDDRQNTSHDRSAPPLIYEATDRGLSFFREWMGKSSLPRPVRHELDLKLIFASAEIIPDLMDQVQLYEYHCLNRLRSLSYATREPERRARATSDEFRELIERLQLDGEVKILQARIEWLRNMREGLATFTTPKLTTERGSGV
jgi:DNA-binding PadR family transcriptional regulator